MEASARAVAARVLRDALRTRRETAALRHVVLPALRGTCGAAALVAAARDGRAALHHRKRVVPAFGRAQLAPEPVARRFASRAANAYAAELFAAVAAEDETVLSRYDLFHAHLVRPEEEEAASAALVFHCLEYPAFCEERFPFALGFGQENSDVEVDARSDDGGDEDAVPVPAGRLATRTVLWVASARAEREALVRLDTSAPELAALLVPGCEELGTVDETLFGDPVADVTYLHSLRERKPAERVFVTLR